MVRRRKSRLERFFSLNQHRKRWGARRHVLAAPDLVAMRERIVQAGEPVQTRGSDKSLERHLANLRCEFSGRPELLLHHATLIVLIRREVRLAESLGQFTALWAQEAEFLCRHLNLRWLISAADTFADHGPDPQARAVAMMASLLANTVKIGESDRYVRGAETSAPLPLFETSAQYSIGSADRENYHNLDGAQGPMFGRSELDATSLSLNAGFNVPLGESFIVSPSIAYSHATRDNRDVFSSLTRPTVAYNPANPTARTPNGAVPARSSSYERTYSGWSPSLGVSWRPDESQTLFGAVSRTFEPPTHDDLLATVNGTPNSGPGRSNPGNPLLDNEAFHTPDLKAQTATTVEAGWRGSRGGYAWDATVYYSWVDNELLNLRDVTGASLGAINAGKTSHLGVELGLTAQLTDQWSGRVAYTFQDFRFRDHAIYGDNRLAGAPRHVVNAVLQYDATENWMLQGAVRWLPARTPVDNANTLHADPYAVVDLRTQYRVNEHVSFFAEVTNVFDETYAASTLVVDQARPDQAAFIPGDGRGFFLGVSARF